MLLAKGPIFDVVFQKVEAANVVTHKKVSIGGGSKQVLNKYSINSVCSSPTLFGAILQLEDDKSSERKHLLLK